MMKKNKEKLPKDPDSFADILLLILLIIASAIAILIFWSLA